MPNFTILCPGMVFNLLFWNHISPDVIGNNPEIAFKIVLLPAPLAPISPVIEPSATSNVMPLMASALP
jgi:hypothetical protein